MMMMNDDDDNDFQDLGSANKLKCKCLTVKRQENTQKPFLQQNDFHTVRQNLNLASRSAFFYLIKDQILED